MVTMLMQKDSVLGGFNKLVIGYHWLLLIIELKLWSFQQMSLKYVLKYPLPPKNSHISRLRAPPSYPNLQWNLER